MKIERAPEIFHVDFSEADLERGESTLPRNFVFFESQRRLLTGLPFIPQSVLL